MGQARFPAGVMLSVQRGEQLAQRLAPQLLTAVKDRN